MEFTNSTNETGRVFQRVQHDILVRCKRIESVNMTQFFRTDLLFDGIPESTILNSVCFLIILISFLILKKISWISRHYRPNEFYKVGWISLLYRDVYEFIATSDLNVYGATYVPRDTNLSYLQMLKHSFYGITARDVLERCGADASQYLTFHRYILYFMVYNMVVCICIILPANIKGNLGSNFLSGRHFERTTMANLNIKSNVLWYHVTVAFVNPIILLIIVCAMNMKLRKFGASSLKERTVLLTSNNETNFSSISIKEYINEHFPGFDIENIKLVYDYKRLIYMDAKFCSAEENYKNFMRMKNSESHDIMVSENSCIYNFFCCILNFCRKKETEKKDGERFYWDNLKKYRDAMCKELNRLPKTMIPLAFVTFKSKASARKLLSIQPRTTLFRKCTGEWAFSSAPEPTDIIWENVREGYHFWTFRALYINFAVFCVAFFATSPYIVVSSFNLDKMKTSAPRHHVVINRFFVSIFIVTLSTIIPNIIIYSSDFLEFETKNSLYKSVVKKTYFFLAVTVVLLPSLGQTSLDGFLRWTITKHNQTYDWSCIFLVDNGVFFVDYVMTMAFIAVAAQLFKFSEIAWCVYKILTSKSKAECVSIRKQSIWPFSFGIQYAYSLFIFTMVTFFNLPCPIISIYGLLYFTLKYVVDRYNIYYSNSPSKINPEMHVLVMQLVILALTFKASGFFFLLYIRGGWGLPVTYAACANLAISLFTFTLASGCGPGSTELFGFLPLGKYKKGPETQNSQESVSQDKEAYQPTQIQKYLHLYSCLDEYGNPLDPKKEADYNASSRIVPREVFHQL